jgi:lipopolysaccharide transport system ATP-binding protein
MSGLAIRVRDLGKEYRIGAKAERYKTLRESLVSLGSLPQRVFRRSDKRLDGRIWALRDVNFEVAPGEVVGIIGRNGSGKSTLLKVLSRITDPTTGSVEIRGRVGSLLEVGTGFHPELTGRENVYLNGAILGMRRLEIDRKFDQIVAFSEIEEFIDTPVKKYSSGMYLRLAFAVAAHLEPEILLVDEVLAVGDADFQKKCLGKMGDVAREGRTVLFVSHNMPAVQALCARAILLRHGAIAFDGDTGDVLREYLGYLNAGVADAFGDNPDRSGDGTVRLTAGRILDDQSASVDQLVAGASATLQFEYENSMGVDRIEFQATIINHLGVAVTHFSTMVSGFTIKGMGRSGVVSCHIPNVPLPRGEYRVAVAVRSGGTMADHIPNALGFRIEGSTFFPTGKLPPIQHSACLVVHEWGHRAADESVSEGTNVARTSSVR